jgi:hypothetical protein
MDKPTLDAVFMAPAGKGQPAEMGAPDGPDPKGLDDENSEESDQALDDSIDEMFATDDPVQRREAFKRAMTLCNQQQY